MYKKLLIITLCLFAGGLFILTAAQDDEASPAYLARLVRKRSAEESADISASLLAETIRMDDDAAAIRRRVVILSSVLVSGVSRDGKDVMNAVAETLAANAGPELEREVIATIALIADKIIPEAKTALDAALAAIPEERAAAARQAAGDPGGVLGLRLGWTVRNTCEETLALLDEWLKIEGAEKETEVELIRELGATAPSTTTTTTSTTTTTTSSTAASPTPTVATTSTTTTTSTTRPSPTPVGRR